MIPDYEWHTYYLDMSQSPAWAINNIQALRIQPSDSAGIQFELDYIRHVNFKPDPKPFVYFGFEPGRQAWGDVLTGVTNLQAVDGVLSGDSTNNNPTLYGPYLSPFFSVADHSEWEVRMKASAGTELQIYWTYSGSSWHNDRSITVPIIADNQWHTYTIDMSQNPEWTDHSPAIMRIDPSSVAGAHFEIDYIRSTDAPVPGE